MSLCKAVKHCDSMASVDVGDNRWEDVILRIFKRASR
jgi:hypothetical protein